MNVQRSKIPDEVPRNLKEQLLLKDAKAGSAKKIQGSPDEALRDAPRLTANYGGNLEDWVKMSSIQAPIINGASVQVHWFRNTKTLEDVELKFKRVYPRSAPKKQ
ncbi:MAG: hypothetical protein F6J86_46285 [Symploca sp. SIO1B1]|nr:hypothetical protein [Symploca sp. SIO1B1]